MASKIAGTQARPTKPEDRRKFQQALREWFGRCGRDLPWRRTRDPYAILVSEFMLQQTQVATVLNYYRRWMERFPTAEALAAAPLEEVLRAWEGLGYYARARNLHRAAAAIGAEFPRELAGIAALPGVGRYTAGAVATFAFDLATPIVDANIARVLARLIHLRIPIDAAPGQRAIWAAAERLVPGEDARVYNSALMELGALVCKPRDPQCLLCPVREFCAAAPFGPERLPIKKARRAVVALEEDCAWIAVDGRLLLQQETGTRWRGLWKLPPHLKREHDEPLAEWTYPFTHHVVTLRVYAGEAPAGLGANQRWHDDAQLEAAAMAAPHRKAVRALSVTARASPRPTATPTPPPGCCPAAGSPLPPRR